MDVGHPVREVDALEPALVEDVRVGGTSGEAVPRLEAAAPERVGGEAYGQVVLREAVGRVVARELRLDLALGDPGRECQRVLHRLHLVGELAVVVRPRLADERTGVGHDVRGASAFDHADVGGRLLVDPAELHLGDRACRGDDCRPALLGEHAGVGGTPVEGDLDQLGRGRPEDDPAGRLGLVVDVPDGGAEP